MLNMNFDIHADAIEDLNGILSGSEEDGIKILAFLEGLRDSPDLLDAMTMPDFGSDCSGPINAKPWGSIRRIEKQNVWRLRSMSLENIGMNYRFVYCYYFKDATHHLVAVVRKKEIDYDNQQNALRNRVVATCRRDFPGN